MQCPDIVRMVRASLDFFRQTEVFAIRFFGFVVVTLLRQKSSQSVSRWMHPCPRFMIFEIIVETDALPQMNIAFAMVAAMIFQLPIKHFLPDRQDVFRRVIGKSPPIRNSLNTLSK